MRISDWSSDVCSSDLVVDSRRPDHAQNADNLLLAIHIGTDDQGRARKTKKLILRADEDAHALGVARQVHQLGQVALFLKVLDETSEARRVGKKCVSTCKIRG